jgi:hypothetical protein
VRSCTLFQVVQQALQIAGWADVDQCHRQELVAAVAVPGDRRAVDRQETQRVQVAGPHRVRVGIEQRAVMLLLGGQCLLGQVAPGDVIA